MVTLVFAEDSNIGTFVQQAHAAQSARG